MQKVIRRTAFAENQAARRLSRKKDKYLAAERRSARENQMYIRRDEIKDIKTARAARKEDYELGPLAPKRDVGTQKDTYGTLSAMRMQGKNLTMEERLEINPHGGRYATIVKDDRVVLLEGRDKGKIGKITDVDRRKQNCTVEGLNMVDVAVPGWMLRAEEDSRPTRPMEQPISLASVRLVYPIPDPTTGTLRDVIVKKLINGPVFHDRHTGRTRWSRIIPGLNMVVPWPKVEPKEHKDHDCDTLRLEVETKTFIPTLLKSPMPSSVIDELRNKYSIFRTRHSEEYIAEKVREDEEKAAKKQLAAEMRTPLKEANRMRRKLRKAAGKPKLDREMLIRIGEVIARKQAASLAALGVQKEALESATV